MRFFGKSHIVRSLRLLSLSLGAVSFFAPHAYANDLNKVQSQIKQQASKVAEQKREQEKLKSTLKKQETKINAVTDELQATESTLKEIRTQIANTEKQIKSLEKQEREQKAKLAKQVDMIYRSGLNPSVLKKMFSQDAAKAERMKVYYQHLNEARIEIITTLKATQANLAEQKTAIMEQQKNHRSQLSVQKKQQQELQKVQNQRQATLTELNRNLAKDESRLEALKASENALRQEIRRAEQAAREQERREQEALAQRKQAEEKRTSKPYQPTAQERQLMSSTKGLGAAKKQYVAPVSGPVLHAFGSLQVGEIRWKGTVIAAPAGTPVKAIAPGRVISATYMDGFGYFVAIRHGDDLTQYAYNQSIAVKVNQLVSAGQVIAYVGNTGDVVNRPALYFGVSRKGVNVNPMGWVR